MKNLCELLCESWASLDGNESIEQILQWIKEKNENLYVSIKKINLQECGSWKYDNIDGTIKNGNNSFFSISGIRLVDENKDVEQPIIIQNEIGYLGIICKIINGKLHFLMQAKIEPGNVNKIQISPTIQATKSNFTQKHGGKRPNYLDYFLNAKSHKIIVDQIQSEQSSRFLKKRNRNIIIFVKDDIDVLNSHKWMTLGQIKALMKINNLVNMDTRTVLSCIPYSLFSVDYQLVEKYFKDKFLAKSIFNDEDVNDYINIYHYINNFKMFNNIKRELIPLGKLKNWKITSNDIHSDNANFKVIYCDISIEGREVSRWQQPLFEAIGMATFGLFVANIKGKKKFLVRAYPEIGTFDNIEIGPTIQKEPIDKKINNDIEKLFFEKLKEKKNIKYDVILSEEGGRFYQEQNKNIIIEIDEKEITNLPNDYFWIDYHTLNLIQQINNTINIQLRNLLSLLEV